MDINNTSILTKEEEKLRVIKNAIDFGNRWYKQKIDSGWQETEFGLMPPDQIKESGLIRNAKGDWVVPMEERIAENKSNGYRKGEKYFVIPEKFLKWYRKLTKNMTYDDHIDNEIRRERMAKRIPPKKEENLEREYNLDDIPF